MMVSENGHLEVNDMRCGAAACCAWACCQMGKENSPASSRKCRYRGRQNRVSSLALGGVRRSAEDEGYGLAHTAEEELRDVFWLRSNKLAFREAFLVLGRAKTIAPHQCRGSVYDRLLLLESLVVTLPKTPCVRQNGFRKCYDVTAARRFDTCFHLKNR